MGFVISPVLAPFLFGFFVVRAKYAPRPQIFAVVHVWSSDLRSWRWSYGVGTMFGVAVTLLIAFFMEET